MYFYKFLYFFDFFKKTLILPPNIFFIYSVILIMPDKKVVDDYYSQINSSNEEIDSNAKGQKPKIVVKKKIIVKKAKTHSENDEVVSWGKQGQDWNKQINKKNVSHNKSPKSKWFIQKVEVVKRDDISKNDNVSKDDSVSKKDNTPKKFTIVKRDNTPKKFTIVKKGDADYVDKSKKTWNTTGSIDWVKFKLRNSSSDDQSKKFTNNKKPVRWSGPIRDVEVKKSRLAWWDKRVRWRFKFWEEKDKDITFLRSNKVNKKEDKNIEDIKQKLVEKKWETVIVPEVLSLKELSEKIGVTLPMLMAEFMKNWMMVNINSKIDFESASIIADAFDIKLEKNISAGASVKDIMSWNIADLLKEENQSKLIPRSPVVSIMGHVDHGKTSLLDYIRKAKVASGEAWGITQSIWAYQVELDNGKITFLDTPGHEAFSVMRARWAKLTDIAILVVAADEWVKPQTIESINHAKEADIPVIVAINKMDKEWANPDHVKGQLSEHWLMPEDWGWDTPMVPVSAHSGFWIDDLLEIILLVAEMKELKANPDRAWIATVIESHLDHKLWPVATVLVNTWTIHMWDNMVCQDSYWKIKVLKNYGNKSVKFVTPWEPALIVWLDRVVDGWDILQAVNSVELAKHKAEEYRAIIQTQKTLWASWLELLMSKIKAWSLKHLKIILKADTNGSLEAIKGALIKLSTPETTVQVIHAWVWSITESDVLMGQWSEALLVWFNVSVLPTAKGILESSGVEYISSEIIYHITEKIEKIVTWMLDPKEVEIALGKAKVWWIFFTWKGFIILGLKLEPDNKIEKKALVRIIRKKKFIWNWVIESLKSWTLEMKELEWPIECWINLKTSVDIEMWDELEIHKIIIQK